MNPIREAAEAIHAAEKRVSALSLRMDVSHKYVHVTGRLKHWELSRSVSWAEIDDAPSTLLSPASNRMSSTPP